LVPSNIMAVVALQKLQELLKSVYPDETEFVELVHKLEGLNLVSFF